MFLIKVRCIGISTLPYIVLFKAPRDDGQMKSLAHAVFPSKVKFSMDSFREARKKDHGYLLIEFDPLSPDRLRVRKSLLMSDEVEIFQPASETKEVPFAPTPARYKK